MYIYMGFLESIVYGEYITMLVGGFNPSERY